ncbi:ABC transporter permease [Salinibacterium hongtaonis]|uniref:ABC transporter permease n=1 Tax=Homoserinimonas hongtaonis TaxID=2079791 RepID=UPI000D3AE554|nr:ABC transporter permease [Salinibacterium hongtaonis]AWB88324.1 glycine/betaine ABC transporter permease [Salinibacterium hongtaonis]
MNLLLEAFAWLANPEQYVGPNSIPLRLGEHLVYTAVSLLIAAIIGIPLGYLIGHTGKGRELAVGLSGAARALPSFGLILLLVLVLGVTNKPEAAYTAFVILAVPSILAGAYAGFEAIDRHIIDAARAMGMTGWQVLWRVEVPLGLPILIGGIRSGALQIVATVTLAAYIGLGGLGYYIFRGLPLGRYDEMLGAAILVALLAIVVDGVLALLQRLLVPRGVTAGRTQELRTSSPRRRAVPAPPTP